MVYSHLMSLLATLKPSGVAGDRIPRKHLKYLVPIATPVGCKPCR
jgi:hypothetical protein